MKCQEKDPGYRVILRNTKYRQMPQFVTEEDNINITKLN